MTGNRETGPRVTLSASVAHKVKEGRKLALEVLGEPLETALELLGVVKGPRVIVTDAVVPRARCGVVDFQVSARDLSKALAQAAESPATRHASHVAKLHFHPPSGCGAKPVPSLTDQTDDEKQAALAHVFNLSRRLERKSIVKPTLNQRACCYEVDQYTQLLIPTKRKKRAIKIEYARTALFASVILPSEGNFEAARADVLEHKYSAKNPVSPEVTIYEDAPVEVLSDDEVSRLTGWPKEKIILKPDWEALRAEMKDKYRRHSFTPSSQVVSPDGYEDWPKTTPAWTSPWTPWSAPHPAPGHEWLYLTPTSSNERDLAVLIKEIAFLLGDDPAKRRTEVEFRYLRQGAAKAEITAALKEAWLLLTRLSALH